MILDLQKAGFWKRISAFMLDFILLLILSTGFVWGFSLILKLDENIEKLNGAYAYYENQYGIIFDTTEEEYNLLSAEDRSTYDVAYQALVADEEAMAQYRKVLNIGIGMTSLGIFTAFLIYEFFIPLKTGNGRTVGKIIFNLAVMRTDSVKISGIQLFIRSILGKYTIETMVPVMILLLLMIGGTGANMLFIVFVITVAQIALQFKRKGCFIHDYISDTVVVDFESQMIFDSSRDMVDYKAKVAAEEAENKEYL